MAWDDAVKSRLMAYCRIDTLEAGDELLLQMFYEAAVSYLEQAGVSEPKEKTARRSQYDLCVSAMVLDSWDHRDTKEPVSQMTENPAFRDFLNQLKLTEPEVSESDTAEVIP